MIIPYQVITINNVSSFFFSVWSMPKNFRGHANVSAHPSIYTLNHNHKVSQNVLKKEYLIP